MIPPLLHHHIFYTKYLCTGIELFFQSFFSTESETILIGTGIEITHFFKSNSNSSKAGVPLGVTESSSKSKEA